VHLIAITYVVLMDISSPRPINRMDHALFLFSVYGCGG
jgi:hypothetical protein